MSGLKFAYGVMGEGRGHTVRALALGKLLNEAGHEIRFFTKGQSEELITASFGEDSVQLTATPRFGTIAGRVYNSLTAIRGAVFWLGQPFRVRKTIREMGDWRPDVIISDFEPTMPRVANRLNIPCISFDSQHFTLACDLSMLPRLLRIRLSLLAGLAYIFNPRPSLIVVSKPFSLPTKRSNMHLVGPMLRGTIEHSKWKPAGTHILCYSRVNLRRPMPAIFQFGETVGEVRLYGHHPKEAPSYVLKRPISDDTFVEDMLAADMVICTAGSQLIGELAVLGVPTLLIPEPGQIEQEVNARLAVQSYENFAQISAKKVTIKKIAEAFQQTSPKPNPELAGAAIKASDLIFNFLDVSIDTKKK